MCYHNAVISQFIMAIIFSLGTIAAANAMHTALIHNVMRLPLNFFDTTPLGRILNRFSKDVDTCDNVLPHVTRMLIAMNFTVSLINIDYSFLQKHNKYEINADCIVMKSDMKMLMILKAI